MYPRPRRHPQQVLSDVLSKLSQLFSRPQPLLQKHIALSPPFVAVNISARLHFAVSRVTLLSWFACVFEKKHPPV